MMADHKRYAIGIDLGGTKIKLGLIDDQGNIHQDLLLETQAKTGVEAIEKKIVDAILQIKEKSNLPIIGVGVGVAGQIEAKTGKVFFAPNLVWRNVPLKDDLVKAVQLPVQVINDVRAITLGEWRFGAGRGVKDLLCLFVGTGIGAGVIHAGHLLEGDNNMAAEVGHMSIDYSGPACSCGSVGCFEALAGGWGLTARALEAILTAPEEKSGRLRELSGYDLHSLTAKEIIQAYHEGDPLAIELIENFERALIAGVSNLLNLYNPARLILGGGLIDGMPDLISKIEKGSQKLALHAAVEKLTIVKATLGGQAGIIGAASLFLANE